MKWQFIAGLIQLGGVLGQVYSEDQMGDVCERNQATCKVLCYNHNKMDEDTNSCHTETLEFSCVCSGGYTPSATNNTFPAAVAKCQTEGKECKLACNGETECANKCEVGHVCFPVELEKDKSYLKSNTTTPAIRPASVSVPSSAEEFATAPADPNSFAVAIGSHSGLCLSTLVAMFLLL